MSISSWAKTLRFIHELPLVNHWIARKLLPEYLELIVKHCFFLTYFLVINLVRSTKQHELWWWCLVWYEFIPIFAIKSFLRRINHWTTSNTLWSINHAILIFLIVKCQPHFLAIESSRSKLSTNSKFYARNRFSPTLYVE